ncbi:hypothetical protein AWB74_01530 [Caballeronia arvi]|uniref:Uncharacterized protein n=1 Tax=Caballeronia arvi TaxID=1777135 RepID=A0A158H255_9BURK|nr:hypothetical protein [Caballeronia arvi]SAL38418.1 hypothetical protein AWB74_01530 [Caballeronia arvi]
MGDNWIFLGDGVSQRASEASWTAMHFPRRIDRIRIMRLPVYSTSPSIPGHYWFEIDHGKNGPLEGYGWYPAEDISHNQGRLVPSMFDKVEGCINGDSPARREAQEAQGKNIPVFIAGGGIGTKPYPWDPHQKEKGSPSISHPYVLDDRSEEEIIQSIRDYAASYKSTSNGKWSFKLDVASENNCHTFVWRTLYHCQLIDVDVLSVRIDPHFASLRLNTIFTADEDYVAYIKSKASQVEKLIESHAASGGVISGSL